MSVSTFIVGTIFLIGTMTSVIAYTFKDILQKENVINFIKTNVTPQLIEEQCTKYCQNITQSVSISFDQCMQICREQAKNETQNIDSYIDSAYSQQLYKLSLGS